MGRRLEQLEQMLDRRWRGGHPFRPRLSRRRRVGMMAVFVLLCAVIGAYWYLTDADRVREKAEAYLSRVLGGRVEVDRANLSIFEGLRLDGVRVHADQSTDEETVLFSARTFRLDYNPRALLAGKLEAAQIVAIGPHVRLTQDRATGDWNFERMVRRPRDRQRPATRPGGQGPVVFPEILLRDGRVDNGEVVDGAYRETGRVGFEGRLSPTGEDGRYVFELQAHGLAGGDAGPVVNGWFVPRTGQTRVRLKDFAFGTGVQGMLPPEFRQWWEAHAVAGRIDTTDLTYAPARGDRKAEWRVETSFKGVTLVVRPEEWRGARQNQAFERVRDAVEWCKALEPSAASAPAMLFRFTRTVPLKLEDGEGVLAFSEGGVEVRDLRGFIEGSGVSIRGRYDGYGPDAPMQVRIESVGPGHLTIPEDPGYIWSLPGGVQEIWRRFRPVGSCRLAFDVVRPHAGAKPEVSGEVEVIDGLFTCDRFPYTLRNARGTIVVGRDEVNGEKLELRNLRGQGRPGGPNADGWVTVSGLVDHLGPDPGMYLEIASKDVVSEPAVLEAIPRDVRDILDIFDAPGKGEFPRFAGDFTCWIKRPPGKDQHITVELDLDIRKASGRLISFPYPLEDVAARVEIRDDYVDIPWARMKRGDTSLEVGGRVRWKDRQNTGEKIGTNLRLAVRGMGIDKDLLDALTPVRRKWLQAVGLGGTLDFDGRVYSDRAPNDIVTDLELSLRDGVIWPGEDGTYAVTGVAGKLHLAGDSLELKDVTGRRGEGTVALGGKVSWTNDQPKVALKASATNLSLDAPLYELLPPAGRTAWDEVAPAGTVDAEATYDGGARFAGGGEDAGFAITVRPRKLSVTPKVAPYRLDDLTGAVRYADGTVTLDGVTGRHGPGTVSVSGSGVVTGAGQWDLRLGGKDLTVDAEFLAGMPEAVSSLLKSMEYQGSIGFDLPTLTYRAGAAAAGAGGAAATATQPSTRPGNGAGGGTAGELDFAGSVTVQRGTMTAGVPMSEVDGKVDVRGAVRDGRLSELTGGFEVGSMKVAGRDAREVRAEFAKAAGDPQLHVRRLQGQLAGGALSGEVGVRVPHAGPADYAVNVVLRNADVSQITEDPSLNGQFTASLELEGNTADPKSRRGRGDVLATGREMYKVPVMMGLLQIANLSLPFTSPFREATAQYILQGDQVVFESIELRGDRIVMRGNGLINFADKQVRLTFNTDSPTRWLKVPIFQDLMQTARRELFQITIRGTVQEPKVSAQPFHTVTTTVDEVFNGERGDR